MTAIAAANGVGELLRGWRQRRRLSQLDLAVEAEVSTRHLSFVETGRARPSRELVLHLAEQLDVPLRERNALLLAAGYAPLYRESALDTDELTPVRAAIEKLLSTTVTVPASGAAVTLSTTAGTPVMASCVSVTHGSFRKLVTVKLERVYERSVRAI